MNPAHKEEARRAARLLPAVALFVVSPAVPARAWGDRAHQLVNAAAVENLPEPLRGHFRARKVFLVERAMDPDTLAREEPRERPHHYTDADAYGPEALVIFKRIFIEERRGPPVARERGDSVWQIESFTLRLAQGLGRRDWAEADHAALFVAHYACDLTQPLHTVANYDGQFTNQSGIHARFERDLVNALAQSWRFHPPPPVVEGDLRARIFRELFDSYSYRNPLFAADRIAVEGRTYLDPQYFQEFARLAGLLAKKRLEAAIGFVSSLWYTAWVRAGKPALPTERKERVSPLGPFHSAHRAT